MNINKPTLALIIVLTIITTVSVLIAYNSVQTIRSFASGLQQLSIQTQQNTDGLNQVIKFINQSIESSRNVASTTPVL